MLENVATRDWEEGFRRAKIAKAISKVCGEISLQEHLLMVNDLEAIIDEKDRIIEDLLKKGTS